MRGASIGELSGRYEIDIAVMRYMRWGWHDFRNAPDDLVEEIIFRMGAEARWTVEHRKQQDAINQQLAARGRK